MSGHEIRSVGTTVGTIGATAVATVDERGVVDLGASGVGVEWSVKAEHWRRAARVPGVRQQIEVGAPVVTTRLAVAGGDVVQRVYGVAGAVPYVVVEFENASADAVVLAVGLGTSTPPRRRSLDVDGGTVSVDGHDVLFASRPWAQWATAADLDGVMQLVESEATRRDAFVAPTGRHGDSAAVFVWPLAHRTTLRLALALGPTRPGALGAVDLAGAPSADDVALGWDRQLDRAMRIELDDRVVADAAQAARAALLLRVGADRPRPDATTAVALEDWGFDTEAVEVWQRLSVRSRRAARRRRRSS